MQMISSTRLQAAYSLEDGTVLNVPFTPLIMHIICHSLVKVSCPEGFDWRARKLLQSLSIRVHEAGRQDYDQNPKSNESIEKR